MNTFYFDTLHAKTYPQFFTDGSLALSKTLPYDPTTKVYDIYTFPNGRKIVKMHPFQFKPTLKDLGCTEEEIDRLNAEYEEQERERKEKQKDKPKEKGFMLLRNHNKTLKKRCKELWCRKYSNIYYFVHLTTKEPKSFDELNQMFNTFIQALRRKYKKIEYVRAIEPPRKVENPKIIHNHIHAIIEFFNEPKSFNKTLVETHWPHGFVKIEKVYEIYGAIEYITMIKPIAHTITQPDIAFTTPAKTYIPNYTRLVSTSRNFGILEKHEVERITKSELNALLKGAKNDKLFTRKDGHYFRGGYCPDRVYLKPLKSKPPEPEGNVF